MIETEIKILINRKTDIEEIRKVIMKNQMQIPIYILEFENHYEINLTSDYEEWELDSLILNSFPDYEFTNNLSKGKKEIRLQISRYQSSLCTDGWGRPLENPLDEIKYLVKKSVLKDEKFNPKITVLFEDSEQMYFINIVNGINKSTNEKGFLLVNEFKKDTNDISSELFKDRLYKTADEAFRFGLYKIQNVVNEDFKEYKKIRKKEVTELHKIPRRIIRNFIKSCNNNEVEEILKYIDDNIIYEKLNPLVPKIKVEGIQNFKQYLMSSNQDLCSKNFKIRSSWSINLPYITIGLKYFPTAKNNEEQVNQFLKFKQLDFILSNEKIIKITER